MANDSTPIVKGRRGESCTVLAFDRWWDTIYQSVSWSYPTSRARSKAALPCFPHAVDRRLRARPMSPKSKDIDRVLLDSRHISVEIANEVLLIYELSAGFYGTDSDALAPRRSCPEWNEEVATLFSGILPRSVRRRLFDSEYIADLTHSDSDSMSSSLPPTTPSGNSGPGRAYTSLDSSIESLDSESSDIHGRTSANCLEGKEGKKKTYADAVDPHRLVPTDSVPSSTLSSSKALRNRPLNASAMTFTPSTPFMDGLSMPSLYSFSSSLLPIMRRDADGFYVVVEQFASSTTSTPIPTTNTKKKLQPPTLRDRDRESRRTKQKTSIIAAPDKVSKSARSTRAIVDRLKLESKSSAITTFHTRSHVDAPIGTATTAQKNKVKARLEAVVMDAERRKSASVEPRHQTIHSSGTSSILISEDEIVARRHSSPNTPCVAIVDIMSDNVEDSFELVPSPVRSPPPLPPSEDGRVSHTPPTPRSSSTPHQTSYLPPHTYLHPTPAHYSAQMPYPHHIPTFPSGQGFLHNGIGGYAYPHVVPNVPVTSW